MPARTLTLLLALALLLPSDARAEYNFIGSGGVSCGTWTAQRRAGRALALEQWVLGFLSGVGWTNLNGMDPLRGTDAEGVQAWIDNYCQGHPLEQVAGATGFFALAHPR